MKVCDPNLAALRRSKVQWYQQGRTAQIDGIQRRSVLKQVGVINIERDLIDLGQEILFLFVIKYLYVPGNQPSERVQGDLADVDIETIPGELFFQERAPMASQPLVVPVPTEPGQPCTYQRQEKPPGNAKESVYHRCRSEVQRST